MTRFGTVKKGLATLGVITLLTGSSLSAAFAADGESEEVTIEESIVEVTATSEEDAVTESPAEEAPEEVPAEDIVEPDEPVSPAADEPVFTGEIGTLLPWSEATNQASYWTTYGVHEATCYYSTGDSSHGTVTDGGKTVTLNVFNQAWTGDHWELLIIKGGSLYNNVIVHPDAGIAYASPENSGGNQSDVSHWIVCKGTTPEEEPEVEIVTVDTYACDSDESDGSTPIAIIEWSNPTDEDVMYPYTTSDGGSATFTLTANSTGSATVAFTPNSGTQSITIDDATYYVETDGCATVTLEECTTYASMEFSTLAGWDLSQTRATGHNEILEDGLRIWTEGTTSTDKAAGYYSVDFALSDLGTDTIAEMIDYEASFGITPGLQMVVDFDNDGTPDGLLVGEAVYGNNWWLTNSSATFVKDGAPNNGGGNGSQWFGTPSEWLTSFPDARVKAIGYSLGSGVYGDGVIKRLTFGCTNYTFAAEVLTEVTPATPDKVQVCGPDNDSWSYTDTDEYYYVTDYTDGVHSIVAYPRDEFVFPDSAQTEWSFVEDDTECPVEIIYVTPELPTFVDECGTDNDTIVWPEGVTEVPEPAVGIWESDSAFYELTDTQVIVYPKDGYAFEENAAYTIEEDGSIVLELPFTDEICPTDLPTLAYTGASTGIGGLGILGGLLTAAGIGLWAARRKTPIQA